MCADINQQIADNTGLIFKQIHAFNLSNDPDAESIGYEALYKAIKTYSPNNKAKFSTYATVCIYNALGMYLRKKNRVRQLDIISYNSTIRYADGQTHELLDTIESDVDLIDDYCKVELHEYTRKCFTEELQRLSSEKQIAIITAWEKSEFTATTIALSNTTGVSQSYVSQTLNNFKNKMKLRLERYYNA